MRKVRPWLMLILAALLGLLAGMALRPSDGQDASNALDQSHPQSTNSSMSSTAGFFSAPGSAQAKRPALFVQLKRDLSTATGLDRWRLWWSALDQAALEDMPALARLAQEDHEALRIIGTRWAQMDPQHMFAHLFVERNRPRNEFERALADQLFRLWAWRDADAMIAAMNGPDGIPDRSTRFWKLSAADIVTRANPERGLQLMQEWGFTLYTPTTKGLKRWAAADPPHAATHALKYPAGDATEETMKITGAAWGRSDPTGALEFALQNPGRFGNALGHAAMSEWATLDLPGAGDWLAAAEPAVQREYASSYVQALAKSDTAKALKWCHENLSGSTQMRAVSDVLKAATEKDPISAARLVTNLEPSPARAAAALGVAEKWVFDLFKDQSPMKKGEFIGWLNQLDSDSINQVLEYQGFRWMYNDLHSLAQFLSQADAGSVPAKLYQGVAQDLAVQHPRKAMTWAENLPDRGATLAGQEIFAHWHVHQPQEARDWLGELPDGDPRRRSFMEHSIRLMLWLPQAPDHLGSLPETEQRIARRLIASQEMDDSRRAELLAALNRQP